MITNGDVPVPLTRRLPAVLRDALRNESVRLVIGKVVSVPDDTHVEVEIAGDTVVIPRLASLGGAGAAGPQGNPGPTGPAGPQGSTGAAGTPGGIWYVSGQPGITVPADVPAPHTGDMFLYPDSGDVFRYSGTGWLYYGSIRGPAGPTGPQGVQGPAGSGGLTLIQSVTLAAPAASIDFSAIPQTYKSLTILAQLDNTVGASGIAMRFNADAGARYYYEEHMAIGSASTAAAALTQTFGRVGVFYRTGWGMGLEVTVPNYANAVYGKNWLARCGGHDGTNMQNRSYTGMWLTAPPVAVNRITLTPEVAAQFAAGSHAALYGVA